MKCPLTACDAFIYIIYGYLSLDVLLNWGSYEKCYAPTQVFLLLTYVCIMSHKTIISFQGAPDIPRIGKKIANILFYCVMTPGFITLTIIGIVWQVQNNKYTANCIPKERVPGVVWWWIMLLCIFDIMLIIVAIAKIRDWWRVFVFRRRVRRLVSEMDGMDDQVLNQILLSMSQEEGTLNNKVGLSLDDIEKIPQKSYSENILGILHFQHKSCPICYEDFMKGQSIIALPQCEHVYHSSCINSWLLKSPLCPICRANVRNNLYSKILKPSSQVSHYEPVENIV